MFLWYRNHWFHVGAAVFAALAFVMGFWSYRLSTLQTILIYSYMALLAHQFEEYALPGGAPLVINALMYGERKRYDRYPGNKLSMLLVNTVGAYTFYLAAVLFPGTIWLGLAVAYFGFFQLLGHGLIMNIKGRTLYNPGLVTAIVFLVPMGLYYLHYVSSHGLTSGRDYAYGALGFLGAIVFTLVLPIRLCMDRNSPYPLSQEDMSRFHMLEKMKAKGQVDS